MNYEAELVMAGARLHDFIDRYADACLLGARPPDYEREPLALPPKIKRKRKTGPRIGETLSDLLDDIAKTFAIITKPVGYSGIASDSRIGLRRLGPHVIPRADYEARADAVIADPESLSSMMFVASPKREGSEDSAPASFYYAIKLQHLPPEVEQNNGVAFEFGYCVDFIKHTQWDTAHVVVHNDGSIYVCRQMYLVPVSTSQGTYHQKQSMVPVPNMTREGRGLTRTARQEAIATDFAFLVQAWRAKAAMWSVSVRHAGKRATFCVPPKETKHYFKDRDKTALTPAGKRRPIFHFVRQFERDIGEGRTTTVKEHVRGLRSFDWKGYLCAITAPKFHLWVTDGFTLAAEIEDGFPSRPIIYGSKIGSMLAEMEDTQRPYNFPTP